MQRAILEGSTNMISLYVRRRRLGTEIRALREARGKSADLVADSAGLSRSAMSRLENGHVSPDLQRILRILTALEADSKTWQRVTEIAQQAQGEGWWEKHAKAMGARQALSADLEAGAERIDEYHMTLLPGLLQIPAYTFARLRATPANHPEGFDVELAAQARATRQDLLLRPNGPAYRGIIDELAVRRLAAPTSVVVNQLDHLVRVAHDNRRVLLQVLPVDAKLPDLVVPHSSFFTYRYANGDPPVVAVDSNAGDLILDSVGDLRVRQYLDLFEKLSTAALSPADSLDLLADCAQQLSDNSERASDGRKIQWVA